MGKQKKHDFEFDDRRKLMEVADEVERLNSRVDEVEGFTFEFSAIEVVLSYILMQLILVQSNGEADPDRANTLVATTKSQIKAMVGPNADLDSGWAIHYADQLISRVTAKLERDFKRSGRLALKHNG